jgi:hypothetical protein
MSDAEVQLDRWRNRQQWFAVVKHLLCCGFTIAESGGSPALRSPEGELVLALPAEFFAQL